LNIDYQGHLKGHLHTMLLGWNVVRYTRNVVRYTRALISIDFYIY